MRRHRRRGHQRARAECGKGRIDLADRAGVKDLDILAPWRERLPGIPRCGPSDACISRIEQHGNTNGFGRQFMQEPQTLCRRLCYKK